MDAFDMYYKEDDFYSGESTNSFSTHRTKDGRSLKKENKMDALDMYYEEDDFYSGESTNSFFTHRTKDGRSLKIYEMEDTHLISTIDLLIMKLEEAKNLLSHDQNGFKSIVYQVEIDVESVKKKSTFLLITLQKYIFEAVIRDLNLHDQRSRLKVILGNS